MRIGLAALRHRRHRHGRAAGGAGPAPRSPPRRRRRPCTRRSTRSCRPPWSPTTWPRPTACCPPSETLSWIVGSGPRWAAARRRHRRTVTAAVATSPARRSRSASLAARAPARHDRVAAAPEEAGWPGAVASGVRALLQLGRGGRRAAWCCSSTNLIDGSSQVLLLLVSDRKLGLGDGGLRPAQRGPRGRRAGRGAGEPAHGGRAAAAAPAARRRRASPARAYAALAVVGAPLGGRRADACCSVAPASWPRSSPSRSCRRPCPAPTSRGCSASSTPSRWAPSSSARRRRPPWRRPSG